MSSTRFFLLNGESITPETLRFDDVYRALYHADGFFTSFLIHGYNVQALEYHLDRIRVSADVLGFELRESVIIQDLINLSHLLSTISTNVEETVTYRCRYQFWRSEGQAYTIDSKHTKVNRLLVCELYVKKQTLRHLIPVSVQRPSSRSYDSRVKWLAGTPSILAHREATSLGGTIALQTNANQHVSCAHVANVIWISNGNLFLPTASCDALKGTTLAAFTHFCAEKRITLNYIEQSIMDSKLNLVEWILLNAVLGAVTVDFFQFKKVSYTDFTLQLVQEFSDWLNMNATDLRALRI